MKRVVRITESRLRQLIAEEISASLFNNEYWEAAFPKTPTGFYDLGQRASYFYHQDRQMWSRIKMYLNSIDRSDPQMGNLYKHFEDGVRDFDNGGPIDYRQKQLDVIDYPEKYSDPKDAFNYWGEFVRRQQERGQI